MKKTINILIMLIIMTGLAQAVNMVPIELDMSIDFDGINDFRLITPGGNEKHFYAEPNETHADVTWTQIMYYEMEDEWCEGYIDFQNLRQMCENTINNSNTLTIRAITAEKDLDIYSTMLDIEEQRREKCERELNTTTVKKDEYEKEKNTCNNLLTNLKKKESDYNSCSTELEETIESKNGTGLLFGGIGLALGYWIWGRKKKSGPSEQEETGEEPTDIDSFPPPPEDDTPEED